MKKVLITGSTGMLGSELIRVFLRDARYELFGLSRTFSPYLPQSKQLIVDLSQQGFQQQIGLRPDVIIHTAALTDLNLCEQNPELATMVHVNASLALTTLLKPDGRFIYISTDSVFDGHSGGYVESDTPNPLNVYALTKLQGEQAVQNIPTIKSCILRTNIYGFNIPVKHSLAEWAYREWMNGKKILGFTDTIFNAVYTQQLSSIIKFMLDENFFYELLHVASKEILSKFDFLEQLRVALSVDRDLLTPATSDQFQSSIKRPKNTSLGTRLLSEFHDVPEIKKGIQEWVKDLTRLQT
jgi:dTDP-4-dehydrorhamnose reductase